MKIHIISDTHFNHKNIAVYCDRPDDWQEQITNNLALLSDSDLLIHLGDVSLGNDTYWHEFITYGDHKSWLVLGNHDNKSMNWYIQHGWDFVARNFTMYYFGIRILFSHRPYPFPPMKTVTRELRREVAFSEEMVDIPRSNFDINIAGHIHNRPDIQLEKWQKLFILENVGYKPVDLEEFLNEEIKARNRQQQEARALHQT